VFGYGDDQLVSSTAFFLSLIGDGWLIMMRRNRLVPFTFSLNFTNETAAALVDVQSDEGHLVIRFTDGERVTNDTGKVHNNGQPMVVSLLPPEENELPQFTLDDREITFQQNGYGGAWSASPGAEKKRSAGQALSPRLWALVWLGSVTLLLC